ncbi:hypothetical protein R1flu_028056 [Riccia fluitans]|uniref:glutathione transferase n=1 Tax=Riccia fluitans TaxID=41844 RepID=A0ABD1XL94_9MARC
MAIKIYGSFRSPFVMAAALTVYEKNQEFELVSVAFKSPEYLNNYNPFGKIPAYQDEDITLFESKAIMRYVATKYEGERAPFLLGSTVGEQALCNQWLEVNSHSFTPPLMEIALSFFRTPEGGPSVVEEAWEKLGKVLDIYEARLSASKYLAGDCYTLADLAHTPLFYVLKALIDEEKQNSLTSQRPHVYSWIQDISSRAAWKKLTARPENIHYKQR